MLTSVANPDADATKCVMRRCGDIEVGEAKEEGESGRRGVSAQMAASRFSLSEHASSRA